MFKNSKIIQDNGFLVYLKIIHASCGSLVISLAGLKILLGATVADAAARPLHWIYDSKKLKSFIRYCLF